MSMMFNSAMPPGSFPRLADTNAQFLEMAMSVGEPMNLRIEPLRKLKWTPFFRPLVKV
jgi:hypothetical protein